MKPVYALLIAATLVPAVTAADDSRRTVNDGNVVLDNVPEIPSRITDQLSRYQNVRGARGSCDRRQEVSLSPRTLFLGHTEYRSDRNTARKDPSEATRQNGLARRNFLMVRNTVEHEPILFSKRTPATLHEPIGRAVGQHRAGTEVGVGPVDSNRIRCTNFSNDPHHALGRYHRGTGTNAVTRSHADDECALRARRAGTAHHCGLKCRASSLLKAEE